MASKNWVLSSQSQRAQHPSVGRCPEKTAITHEGTEVDQEISTGNFQEIVGKLKHEKIHLN